MSPYGWRNPFLRQTPPPRREAPPEDHPDPHDGAARRPDALATNGRK
ncbi:hypothetical protein GCM10023194_77830 [Planotetraspora phitsanulokensis]|uniref:Uncharacterized protein n=1 Tax=Planotetraspora phitsanulokensis TaxID=575192 RepID=A0A8J3UHE7_9ACTN|nr:hypothetical protein Pph01_83390 [Planotetraspora phitsanulokensis]